ncbi:MAG: hypothetical protein WC716_03810 [Chitinophagaceae bacterium]|jgi:hypothetical protein
MKKLLLISGIAVMFLSACDSNVTSSVSETKAMDTAIHSTSTISGKHCYAFVSDKDSIFMDVEINDKSATGKLIYKLSEKDKNEGTFEGTMNADTLFATYHFSSEGMMSDREIIFILNDNKAVEAYGEQMDVNGKMKFKNSHELSLEYSFTLSKENCKD